METSITTAIAMLEDERRERIDEFNKWLRENRAQIKALKAEKVAEMEALAKKERLRKIDKVLRIPRCTCPICGRKADLKIVRAIGADCVYTIHCFRCGLSAPGGEVSSEGIGYVEAQDRASEIWNDYCANYDLL